MIYLQDSDFTLHLGDVLDVLREMPSESVDCVITSPPYWGLRDYGPEGQLGLESTPEQYVERMTEVFREVRRVLAAHGTCWVNMGDSYAGSWSGNSMRPEGGEQRPGGPGFQPLDERVPARAGNVPAGLKPKDLCGIPWRLAFALQADGWYLRSDIVWSKPNPMPESVTDRPTKAHEYVFLLTKSPRYFFDQEAVREPEKPWNNGKMSAPSLHESNIRGGVQGYVQRKHQYDVIKGANIRSVWEIATQPYPEAHFATFPEELVRRCLLAGCPEQVCGECGKPRERQYDKTLVETRGKVGEHSGEGRSDVMDAGSSYQWNGGVYGRYEVVTLGFTDCGCGAPKKVKTGGSNQTWMNGKRMDDAPPARSTYRPGIVLDPFMGSGTTALVARKHSRRAVGIELNAEYCELIVKRTQQLSLLSL